MLLSRFPMTLSSVFRRAAVVPLLAGLFIGIGSTLAATRLGSDIFTDVPEGSYYDQAVGELFDAGILKGDGNRYRPGDNVNRAELAVVIDRLRDELTGNVSVRASSKRSSASNNETASSVSSSRAASSQGSMTTAGAFRFTQGNYTVGENAGSVTITVSRAGGSRNVATVMYTMTAGTATAGSDFTQTTGTLTFADSETAKTFTVQVLDDSTSEGNETVNIALQNPTGTAILTTPYTAIVTITDNESGGTSNGSSRSSAATLSQASSNPNGTLGFGATTYAVPENAGSVTIAVNRTGGTNGVVTVNYATANGSGQSGVEYSATNGTLTFNAGDTVKTFSVPVIDDASIKGIRTFTVTLSAPTGNPSLGTTSAEVTIQDNDTDSFVFGSGSLRFSKEIYEVTENSGYADITVRRVGGASGTVNVDYSATVGTALPGKDFTPISGTMTFLQGETAKIFRVQIIKDEDADGGEAANLTLSNPSSTATLGSPATASLIIY